MTKKVGFSDPETDHPAPSSLDALSESETEKSSGPKNGWAPPQDLLNFHCTKAEGELARLI